MKQKDPVQFTVKCFKNYVNKILTNKRRSKNNLVMNIYLAVQINTLKIYFNA